MKLSKNSSNFKKCLTLFISVTISSIVALYFLFEKLNFDIYIKINQSAGIAAWAQAFGTVLAIYITYFITNENNRNFKKIQIAQGYIALGRNLPEIETLRAKIKSINNEVKKYDFQNEKVLHCFVTTVKNLNFRDDYLEKLMFLDSYLAINLSEAFGKIATAKLYAIDLPSLKGYETYDLLLSHTLKSFEIAEEILDEVVEKSNNLINICFKDSSK